jgi:hypothetical protein
MKYTEKKLKERINKVKKINLQRNWVGLKPFRMVNACEESS